ncbi:MAG: chloride channel protein [Cytophagaceae bacterium]|nr:chloride channel protein [Cytophagaceae bacterium]
MLITSGASGLAAAFNTPLGGIVYVVEELSKSHINKLRVPVFTAVIFAGFTAQFFMGPYLFLGFPKTQTLPLNLIPLGFGLAILGGIFGSLLSLFVLKIFTMSGEISKSICDSCDLRITFCRFTHQYRTGNFRNR